ncbi:MAG: helix-turn-helix domain-containing protein, partial [Candidatus Kapaibacteriota bacterium]
MENLNKEIGERIRFIRSIFNEGGKLSASQFAHLLGETMHKILNYELGRAQVPPSFLATLYYRGINPIFILTGEGSIFAPNRAGEVL